MSKKKFPLKLLGSRQTQFPTHPDNATLEAIPFTGPPGQMTVTLTTDEFTALCPVTGQPDFGTIEIAYRPRKRIVESKSLKFYLFSFRNVGIFQEEIVSRILKDLKKMLHPLQIRVSGRFKPRGGIVIAPVAEWKAKP